MMIGAKDRDYYRVENNNTLIEEAKYNPSVELCIVLAERLAQADWDLKKPDTAMIMMIDKGKKSVHEQMLKR